jgi:hypothetical protein
MLLLGCACTYGCTRDSDCATGEVCQCGEPAGHCVTANCKTDADCVAPALCASGYGAPQVCYAPPESFSCQAVGDACLTDDQCPTNFVCVLDAGHRACQKGPDAICGRPFLVAEEARVAPLEKRPDWCEASAPPRVTDLTDHERRALAEHWSAMGQMEHASIAAFARFALELLALGAPAALVTGAHEAMADETAHARAAFTLASAYAGRTLGPGPLPIDGALGASTARSTFATLLREGCIGETLAAVEATEALADATDAAVRAALARISSDETRHAELAWRTAAWLVEREGEAFAVWARDELANAIAETLGTRLAKPLPLRAAAGLRGHGILDPALRGELRRMAAHGIVASVGEAMFDRRGPRHPRQPSYRARA